MLWHSEDIFRRSMPNIVSHIVVTTLLLNLPGDDLFRFFTMFTSVGEAAYDGCVNTRFGGQKKWSVSKRVFILEQGLHNERLLC